jgi:hypothetical protein
LRSGLEIGIKQAILIIDSEDEESKRVVEKLKKKGIEFETIEAGPKKLGYGVELRVNARERKNFTDFETEFRTPVFIVAYVESVGLKIDVLKGELPIEEGLSKLSEVLSHITLMS